MRNGIIVGGPTTRTSAPSFVKRINIGTGHAAMRHVADDRDAKPFERHPSFADRVQVQQGLGGMLMPSVAGVDHRYFTPRARVSAAPADECRRTMMSACIASILRAVSSSVSPLTTLLEEGEKLITSALNRLAANSNEVRVLVLGSKKRFTTVRPRNAGTFLISRPVTSLNESAVSRINVISSADSEAKLSRSFRFRLIAPSPVHALRITTRSSSPVLFQQYLNVFFT